jgi:hypothetical protein
MLDLSQRIIEDQSVGKITGRIEKSNPALRIGRVFLYQNFRCLGLRKKGIIFTPNQ